jgi:hypothetical protein
VALLGVVRAGRPWLTSVVASPTGMADLSTTVVAGGGDSGARGEADGGARRGVVLVALGSFVWWYSFDLSFGVDNYD